MSETLLNETREEADKRLITRAYRNLLRSIKAKKDKTDKVNIRAAYEWQ